ncbi:hypothetical protein [Streptomyces sp. 147326]|uniref:hypothetical protein n=1 Tax=Streptomyces sp. 147326 TaxID=3074379 RepID=UPI003857DD12
MSEEGLRSTAYLLLLVGHDTTTNVVGNGMITLLGRPEQAARLAARDPGPGRPAAPEPGPGLVATSVEELTLNRPHVRNAIGQALADAVDAALRMLEDGPQREVGVLTLPPPKEYPGWPTADWPACPAPTGPSRSSPPSKAPWSRRTPTGRPDPALPWPENRAHPGGRAAGSPNTPAAENP